MIRLTGAEKVQLAEAVESLLNKPNQPPYVILCKGGSLCLDVGYVEHGGLDGEVLAVQFVPAK